MDLPRGVCAVILQVLITSFSNGKVYERCELARELKDRHRVSDVELATWVCIARYESEFNTSAVGRTNADGSEDHGIFQISDKYWCSPPGEGYGCAISCSSLEDDDLTDDLKCVQRIKRAHDRITRGNGFSAWAVYGYYCKGPRESLEKKFIADCFNSTKDIKNDHSTKEKLLLLPQLGWFNFQHLQPKPVSHYWYLSTPVSYAHPQYITR